VARARLPFEFVVAGVPVSDQSENDRARERWRRQVRAAAAAAWSKGAKPLESSVSIVIAFFHSGESDLDVDNIPKLVLDAVKGLIYTDDHQVEQVTIRRTRIVPGDVLTAMPFLIDAEIGPPFVYIRVDPPPNHAEL
jgi:hypothetical protein